MKLNARTAEGEFCRDLDSSGRAALQRGVDDGVFPGAAGGILIARRNFATSLVWTAGSIDGERRQAVQRTTLYDLASLTKPLVTVLSLLVLIARNRISWNARLDELLRQPIPAPKQAIDLTSLVLHRSGLPAYRPFYHELLQYDDMRLRQAKVVQCILDEPLESAPGSETLYSDLGFILLGEAIERLSGQPLDRFWRDQVAAPLGLDRQLLFTPAPEELGDGGVAVTESCPWSNTMLRGLVHDENCRSLGGVAGHAGLFGTVEGVLAICGHLLRQWRGEAEHPRYPSALVRQIFADRADTPWRCGFDTPSKVNSSSGRFFSSHSVGHLGFTGTSFWIDLERGVAVVLLTNRVHPTRLNEKIRQFRPWFHDAVMAPVVEMIG